jgi:cation diffusion facilitator CzcD-associated flavoprotein CzcO
MYASAFTTQSKPNSSPQRFLPTLSAPSASLKQDFYDQFNRPNINVIDVKKNPICRFEADGIRQEDGTFHKLDVIALATGFDSITGGIKDIVIKGLNGEILSEKWKMGTWTYLGMATARFPNFFFTYGPQAPTAFANGPSCAELQGEWLAQLFEQMREKGKSRIEATGEAEAEWKELVDKLSLVGLRGHTDSWYNGGNIPGKPKEALVYAGGIPLYLKTLEELKGKGYSGFVIQ